MPRRSLVQQATEELFDRILDGRFPVDAPLPPQSALAADLEVSRLTIREAVEALRASDILRVVHGSGSYVNAVGSWSDAEAITRYLDATDGSPLSSLQLMEVRRLVESGAAETCATRRSGADVVALERHDQDMREAHAIGDVDGFVAADLAFHEQIIRGSGNPFMWVTYAPLIQALRLTRQRSSSVTVAREHTLDHHVFIMNAIRAGDGAAAGVAMAAHIEQVSHDLCTHVFGCVRAGIGGGIDDEADLVPLGCLSRPGCLRAG